MNKKKPSKFGKSLMAFVCLLLFAVVFLYVGRMKRLALC